MTYGHLSRLTPAAVSPRLWKWIFCTVRCGCDDFQRVSPPKYRTDTRPRTPQPGADGFVRCWQPHQLQQLVLLPHVRLFVYATARVSDPALPGASRCCGVEMKFGLRSWNSLRQTRKLTDNLNFRPVQKFARLKYAQLHSEQGNLSSVGLWAPGDQHNASLHSFSIGSYKTQRNHSLSKCPTFSSRDSRITGFPESRFFPFPRVPRLGHTLPSEQAVRTGSLPGQADQDLALLFVHLASGFLI